MKTYSIPNTNYSLGHAVKSHRRSFYQFNLLDMASESNESFVTEAGDIEKWGGNGLDNKKLTEDLQEYIEKLKDHVTS